MFEGGGGGKTIALSLTFRELVDWEEDVCNVVLYGRVGRTGRQDLNRDYGDVYESSPGCRPCVSDWV